MDIQGLSLDTINSLLADTRKRGVYEPRIQEFVDSGELACNFTAFPEFSKMDSASVRNSVKQNVDKKSKENDWPKMQVVLDRSDKENIQVVLINLELLAEAQADATEDTNEPEA